MIKTDLSIATVVEKNRIESDVAFLLLMKVEVRDSSGALIETLRLVRNNENVTVDGNLYTAFPFGIDIVSEAGKEPSVQLSIEDVTGAIQQTMEPYDGGIGFEVVLMVVNMDPGVSTVEASETFRVVDATVSDYTVTWTLGAESHLAIPFPPRRQIKDTCPWNYKDNDCKYDGELPSCDFSLEGANGCAAHENEINFGGFPALNPV